MLQPLPQLLLPFRSQPAECWIVLQFPLLFRWRQILIVPSTSPRHAPVAQDAPAAVAEAAVVVEPGALLRPVLPAVREKPRLYAPDTAGELSSQSPTRRAPANPSCNLPASSPPPYLSSPISAFATIEPSTESLQHPVADPGHPANRNPHTSRDSCPRFADRLPRSPPPAVRHSQLRPAHD